MAKNSLGDKVSSSSDQYREPSVSKVIKSTSKVEAGSKRIRNGSKDAGWN